MAPARPASSTASPAYRPTKGRIVFDGIDITRARPHTAAKRGIARTFQHNELFPQLTTLENLLLGRHAALGYGLSGESLRDIRFLHFRDTSINGIRTEVARVGMTGSLAYELHGPIEEGPAIYDAVYQAGQELGIERLGWGTYLVNHVEGGFPQSTWTFVPAVNPSLWPETMRRWQVSGSVDPTNRARTRTPVEVGWHNMAKFDHDFIGREALAAEIANPQRTTVTLRWNPDDVMDTYASLLRPGDTYKPIDLPYAPQRWPMAHADHVLMRGREIGYSSSTIYSYSFREFLSLGCLDIEASSIGNQVVIQWGDHGGPIKNVRATVARFPYLTEGRNSDVDVTTFRAR